MTGVRRSNYHDAIERGLRCPRCKDTFNIPGRTYIEVTLAVSGATAYCSVCSHSGPLESFQPKETR